MVADVKVLTRLFEEQRELSVQQSKISQELMLVNQKILYSLALHAGHIGDAGGAKAIAATPSTNGKSPRRSTRRSWFERGETVKLFRQVARRSMRPAQVVHAVMEAKGYSNSLGAADKKRVQAALHQAVINAVKAGKLMRNTDGAVRAKA